ncbi:MAG: hypothetical protein JW821_20645 [Deltaproteobacteria bacterium]|nr:hypothetical protein [Deltaproteobacteria bacterium]
MKDTFGKRYMRGALTVLCLVALLPVMVWIRAFWGSMNAYGKAEELLRLNQQVRAVTYFDRAMHWYAPFNPYVGRSAGRLWEISEEAEKGKDFDLALIAVRTIRRGFASAAGLYQPGRDWIPRCDHRIRQLRALASGTEEGFRDEGRGNGPALEPPSSAMPDVLWTLVLELGLFGWIGSVIGFLVFGIERKKPGGTALPRILKWGATAGVFYALWIIGMIKA